MSDPPAPLTALLAELEGRGFVRLPDEVSESFGDRLIELSAGTQAVRLGTERGQWFVAVSAAGGWWDPEVVLATLSGREASDEPQSEDKMAACVRTALARLNDERPEEDAFQRELSAVALRRALRAHGEVAATAAARRARRWHRGPL